MRDSDLFKILLSILCIMTAILSLTVFLTLPIAEHSDQYGYVVCGIINAVISIGLAAWLIIYNIYIKQQDKKISQAYSQLMNRKK